MHKAEIQTQSEKLFKKEERTFLLRQEAPISIFYKF